MNAMQITIVALLVLGFGALALAAWFGRPWDTDGGEYRDANGVSYGKLEP